jgi:hypothetical protein
MVGSCKQQHIGPCTQDTSKELPHVFLHEDALHALHNQGALAYSAGSHNDNLQLEA